MLPARSGACSLTPRYLLATRRAFALAATDLALDDLAHPGAERLSVLFGDHAHGSRHGWRESDRHDGLIAAHAATPSALTCANGTVFPSLLSPGAAVAGTRPPVSQP